MFNNFKSMVTVAVVCAAFFMVSCDMFKTTEAADTGTFTIGDISGKMKLGDTVAITASLSATAAPTSFNYILVRGESDTLKSSSALFVHVKTVSGDRGVDWDLTSNEAPKIITGNKVLEQPCGGTYTLVIQAGLDGKLMATGSTTFEIMGPSCDASGAVEVNLQEASVTAGAQGVSDVGSALDLNGAKSYLVGDANSNTAKIDVFVVGKTINASPFLVTKDTISTYIDTYTGTFNETTLYETALGDDFSKLTNQGMLDLIWDDSQASSKKELTLAKGKTFLVKTADGVVLIKVTDITGTNKTSKVTFSVLVPKR